jgi:CBS domain-containing protein
MTVETILATKGRAVATIDPDRTLGEAAKELSTRRIGAVVIADGGMTVLGILSERDIVRAVAKNGGAALDTPVRQHMTSEVVTCKGHADINEVMQLMTQGKFRHVPVVEDGRLAGIISIGDVVKQRLAEIEAESEALREYIQHA